MIVFNLYLQIQYEVAFARTERKNVMNRAKEIM